jgi:dTDP-4-dehydrorhamnose reductase
MARGNAVTALRHHAGHASEGSRDVIGDLTKPDATGNAVREAAPQVIVHAAALTDVDACEHDPARAQAMNVDAARNVAAAARTQGAKLVHISTDQLWDGQRAMLDEATPPAPLNVYGRSKAEAERAVLAAAPDAMVLRTNFFGRGQPQRPTFSDWVEDGLRHGRRLTMFTDVFFTPIAMELLCPIIVEMVERGATGIYHAVGSERLSKFEFGMRLAALFGYDRPNIVPGSVRDAGLNAPRPSDMSLSSDKIARLLGRRMPDCNQSFGALIDTVQTVSGR